MQTLKRLALRSVLTTLTVVVAGLALHRSDAFADTAPPPGLPLPTKICTTNANCAEFPHAICFVPAGETYGHCVY